MYLLLTIHVDTVYFLNNNTAQIFFFNFTVKRMLYLPLNNLLVC